MKKNITILLICFWIMSIGAPTFALTKLYETSTKQVVNSGTTLTKYKRFTEKGWLAINIIEADLSDENTTVSVLTSANGLHTFQNVKTMLTNEKNCIAAINADFFTGNYQKGNAIGMTMKDGKMLTSAYYENELKDTMASFYIDNGNGAAFDYFTSKITLQNVSKNDSLAISEMNKWSSNYEYPVVYTRDWGEQSPGLMFGVALTEMVVENGIVKEIRNGQEAVNIPANGFVVCAVGTTADTLNAMFQKGDNVALKIDTKIDVTKVKMAVSGGSFLVKNGEVADFTHVIYGSNPRTALGLSKDCKKVYLITVDGRQAVSIGVTQAELAEILVEKGIYNAINLDGGGSTTMIVKELGDEEPTIENYPSDGTLRMVADAVGVFNTDKTGTLSHLMVEMEEPKIFAGCKKEITVKGYDEYYHSAQVNVEKIKWSCTGVDVSVKGNILTAGKEAGTATLTATLGKAQVSFQVNVLGNPNELTISPKKTATTKNGKVTFSVSGQSKDGFESKLNNNEVTWKVNDSHANIQDGVFTAQQEGEYIIEVSVGEAKSYASVNVSNSDSKLINDFETTNFTFTSYPEEVSGKAELSSEEFYTGKKSVKLTYDFTKTEKTRAAYVRFNNGIAIDKNAQTLSVMLYATASTSDQVKAKMKDANGDTVYASLLKGLESKGWQELKLNLKNIDLPATLIDLYVAQDKEDEKTSGSVYFDNLLIEYQGGAVTASTEMPKDIKGEDSANTYRELENRNAFRVVISPELYTGMLLEKLKYQKLENSIKKNAEMVIYPYQKGQELLANISKDKVVDNSYTLTNKGNLTIVGLNILDGGIRNSDSLQWLNLQKDIQNGNKNVLVVLNGNIEEFKDSMEKDLFIDVLSNLQQSTKKNIWVIEPGDHTDYAMKKGVKYLTIHSMEFSENAVKEDIQNTNYIMITVNENEMTYEIKNVFEK